MTPLCRTPCQAKRCDFGVLGSVKAAEEKHPCSVPDLPWSKLVPEAVLTAHKPAATGDIQHSGQRGIKPRMRSRARIYPRRASRGIARQRYTIISGGVSHRQRHRTPLHRCTRGCAEEALVSRSRCLEAMNRGGGPSSSRVHRNTSDYRKLLAVPSPRLIPPAFSIVSPGVASHIAGPRAVHQMAAKQPDRGGIRNKVTWGR